MPAWPASLPQTPAWETNQETPPELALRTQMDAGPAKLRRRFTAGARDFSLQLRLVAAQVATLDNFFINTLAGGTLPFDWLHPRTSAAVQFRFKSPPGYSELGGTVYQVSLELEVLP